MSGILNNKERIFDFIITQEGRRQLSSGDMKIEFLAFSDASVFYQSNEASGSADATERLYLEASNLPQDQIAFESDDKGRLLPYKGSEIQIKGGKILSSSIASGTIASRIHFITSSQIFSSLSDSILSSSIDNFQKLKIIGTTNIFDDNNEFEINKNKINFSISEKTPINTERNITKISINNSNAFYQDKKLSSIPNFKYLPPINKKIFKNQPAKLLGNYPRLGQEEVRNFNDIKKLIKGKENYSITFSETSHENNLVIQVFEQQQDKLLKLDVINFGEIADTENPDFPVKHIYFIGKVFINDMGIPSFINIFTLIFE